MKNIIKLFAGLSVLASIGVDFVFARGGGGGSNLFNSPGYQRAQKESRERYLRAYYGERVGVRPAPHHRRDWHRR